MRLCVCLLTALVILFSCDDEEKESIGLRSVKVWNDETSALSARVVVTLSGNAPLSVLYWEDSESETEAHTTAVSPAKTNHKIALYQLKEKTTYHFRLIQSAAGGQTFVGSQHTFTTAAIPAHVKAFYNEAENGITEESEGFYLFHNLAKPACIYLTDNTGKIIWYRTATNMIKSARFTASNTLLTLQDDNDNPLGDANVVMETSLAGDTLFILKHGTLGFDQMAHHDMQRNVHGNFVLVTNVYQNGIPGDGILVLNRQGQKVWEWNTFREITHIDLSTYAQPWINSLTIDTDGHYIVSLRALCQVWKIHSVTGEVMWKLGRNGNVVIPEDAHFIFQHFAHRSANGEIVLFDNGSAERPASRVLSFTVDETARKAVVETSAFLPNHLYSMIMGSAALLPDDHLLVASAVNGRIVKMDRSGMVQWQLKTAQQIFRVEYVRQPFRGP